MNTILVGASVDRPDSFVDGQGVDAWGSTVVVPSRESVNLHPATSLSRAFNYFEGAGLFLGGLGADIQQGLEYLTRSNPKGSSVHIHVPHNRNEWSEFFSDLSDNLKGKNLKVVLVIGAEEDNWECPNKVDQTVGLAPTRYRTERKAVLSDLVSQVKSLKAVGLDIEAINGHLGSFHKLTDEDYQECVQSVKDVVGMCRAAGIRLGVETGPEPVGKLIKFFRDVDPVRTGQAPVLVANFDPANIVLYGSGEPVKVLKELHEAGRLGSMHLKNAKKIDGVVADGSQWYGSEVTLEEEGHADLVKCLKYVYAKSKLAWIEAILRDGDKIKEPLGINTVIERELDPLDRKMEKLPGMMRSRETVRALIDRFKQASIDQLEKWALGDFLDTEITQSPWF
ncbi:MAG: hypothetical protein RIS36_940 [Pseudomonadota bacterium]|jgi:sugar phosphate isomerase/epimerase